MRKYKKVRESVMKCEKVREWFRTVQNGSDWLIIVSPVWWCTDSPTGFLELLGMAERLGMAQNDSEWFTFDEP